MIFDRQRTWSQTYFSAYRLFFVSTANSMLEQVPSACSARFQDKVGYERSSYGTEQAVYVSSSICVEPFK